MSPHSSVTRISLDSIDRVPHLRDSIIVPKVGRTATTLSRFLPLAALLLTALTTQAQTIQVNKENKTIAITATASASIPADTADISIGFITYGTAQDPTYADCSRISNQVIQTLTQSGITREQIASNEQNIAPINNEDKLHFDKGLRFVCSQTWKVTTPAATAAATLNLAITSGANNSGNIEWRLKDEDTLEAEAARKALTHAQQIADRMAKGLNAKLGPLVYASNSVPNRFGNQVMIQTESAMAARVLTVKPLAIIPDKVTRSATVYAVFAIE